MRQPTQHFGFPRSLVALAVLAACGTAHAEDAVQLPQPESSVSAGLAAVSGDSKDRTIFGQYNGMRKDDAYLLLDVDYLKRDDATGTWTSVQGRNLGLDTPELGFSMKKQGDWKISGEYNEIVKRDLRTINTADQGLGTTTPTIVRLATPGTGSDVDLKLKREGISFGAEKWFGRSLQLELNFKNEDKSGARFWARGYDCASYVCGTSTTTAINQAAFVKNALLALPEPIDSSIKQFDARLNFNADKLNLSAGYYGSFYTNRNGNLTPTVPNSFNNGLGQALPGYPAVNGNIIAGGGTSLQNVLQLPMALPPDNQAHQFYLDGNYAFTRTTKATFKYSYSRATQKEDFGGMGLFGAPSGVSNLDGRFDSTQAQLGLTSKPLPKLSLLANVRYEKKEDKTPDALYNVQAVSVVPATTPASSTNVGAFWNNNHITNTKVFGKLEAGYQLPAGFRGILGADYNSIEREVPTSIAADSVAGLSALRAKTEETGYRAEVRRMMSETLNGAISYSSSRRTGSDWSTLTTLNPSTPGISAANLALINAYCGGRACYGQTISDGSQIGLSATTIFPMTMANLERDTWKLSADWNPMERLSLQFSLEDGKDKNTSAINSIAGGKGWQDTGITFYSIDASFILSDTWTLSGYASRGDQTLHINHSGYLADLNNKSDAVGLNLVGKPTSRLQVGAGLAYLNDVNRYGLDASPSATGAAASATNIAQAAIGLPDVKFRQTTVNLFGKYALDKNAYVRVDLIHQQSKLDEWQWGYNGVPFTYADNTTVTLNPDQKLTFVGVTYIYKFH